MPKQLRLGKQPPKQDERNIKLRAVLSPQAILETPPAFSNDSDVPVKMFGNDRWGDCVVVARANQTLQFENFEQDKLIPITTAEVLREYWKEQGASGDAAKKLWIFEWWEKLKLWWKYYFASKEDTEKHPDNGLVVLESLNAWRKGWIAAENNYNIYAFGEINVHDHMEVKASVYLLRGAIAGIALPLSAQTQFYSGQFWDIEEYNAEPNSWGGHCVYISGYNTTGPICGTWGKEQQMTWAFWDKYCDECYAIVDNRDNFLKDSPVNVEELDKLLHQIES